MAQEKVRTRQVEVRVYVRNGAIVEGVAHVHAGAYQRRISDVLNIAPPNFLPVTAATYELGGERRTAETILIAVSDIVMVETGEGEGQPIGADTDLPG